MTWRRWWRLGTGRYSLLREIEYDRLKGLRLSGRTLDIGGGARNSYYHLFQTDGAIESVNISPEMKSTLLADLNDPLPLESGIYDTIISLNTFEHIYNDTGAIAEALRVLKPGGSFHIVVPFLYRVHGSPYDYHRHTAAFWEDFLCAREIKAQSFRVEPLMWDPLSSAFSLVEFTYGLSRVRRVLRPFIMLPALLLYGRHVNGKHMDDRVGGKFSDYALGYYIHGTKT